MLELNRIYNLDALSGLRLIDDKSIDLVITSPPYNLRNKNGKPAKLTGGGKWKSYALIDGYDEYNDALPHDQYVKWQKEILTECWRCLKPTGAIFYNHKPIIRDGKAILPTEYNPNLPIRQIIIWERAGGLNFNIRFYLPTHEWIVVFAKPDFKLKSQGASGIKDIWKFPQEKGNKHPAPFPIQLPLNILETVQYNQLTIDCFVGSGTTALACKKLGLNYIGFDKSKLYCEMAGERLNSI